MVAMANDALRRRGRLIPLAIVACALAVATAACSESEAPPVTRTPVPATNAASAPLLPTDSRELPAFTYEQYQSLLGQLKGTPVVVNIWGSWCGPCRDEAAHLTDAAETYGDRIQFLGVDILDAPDSARKFMDEYGWTYPSIFDPSAGGDIRNQLGYLGQPVTIFYDADGNEVGHYEGAIPAEELDRQLQKLLLPSGGITSPSASP